ncbi:hypothetical protein J1782_08195 [Rahnella sp. BCC 1045]|uniref:hypothetical protein n=1 Tax=Rahnella sp. BCC 1045 TaxID=2816251 RepID=UPI001C265FE8|nr:hypothetical protein [Rahnella sp. BCC 1045]MBU9819865.1 hypothetical protein [Rahnella sp. BCC 1045]
MRQWPAKAAFHFTSSSALSKIRDDGVIRAGRNGTVFCTLNPKLSRVGSGKTKTKSKTPPAVVFRKDALKQFRKNDVFWAALINGHRFYGIIFCECLPKKKGDIVILKSRSYLNVLIIEDAVIKMPAGKRGFAIRYLSFITGSHKWLFPLLPLISTLSLWHLVWHKDVPMAYQIYIISFGLVFFPACFFANCSVMKRLINDEGPNQQ